MSETVFNVLLLCAGGIAGWVVALMIVDWLLKRIGFDVDFWRAMTFAIHSLPVLDRLKWPEDD